MYTNETVEATTSVTGYWQHIFIQTARDLRVAVLQVEINSWDVTNTKPVVFTISPRLSMTLAV
jgi:hypothetical protein